VPIREPYTICRKCKSPATRMTSKYPVIAPLGWLALVLGAALLGSDRERRLAAAGLLTLGVGLAAWWASSADPAASLTPPDRLGDGFLVVNGGLLLLGLGLVLWAAASGGPGRRPGVALLATALGVILVARLTGGLLLAGGLLRVVSAGVALGLVGATVLVLGRTIAGTGPVRALGSRLFSEPLTPGSPANRRAGRLAAALLAGAAAAALGPHLAVVFLGVIVAAWSAYFLFHPGAGRPAPVTPSLTLLLAPVYWLLSTIAGPEGLGVAALPLVPLSPAAESLVASALLLVGWSVAGLWPMHRQVPGALVGAIGALLLIRIALPLAPDGLEYWRPLAVPVLIVGIWHAAARARWPLLAAGAGFLGIAGLTLAGATGAGWLLGLALVLELCSMLRLPVGTIRLARVAAWVPAAWGGLLVLEGGLRGEVVYTALGAAGLALLIASRRRHAITASVPSTTEPSA
jgi:hypothetical protein